MIPVSTGTTEWLRLESISRAHADLLGDALWGTGA
jgi:hypothetical protein